MDMQTPHREAQSLGSNPSASPVVQPGSQTCNAIFAATTCSNSGAPQSSIRPINNNGEVLRFPSKRLHPRILGDERLLKPELFRLRSLESDSPRSCCSCSVIKNTFLVGIPQENIELWAGSPGGFLTVTDS